jgi:tetratricopeptide (TPR) repeat protein
MHSLTKRSPSILLSVLLSGALPLAAACGDAEAGAANTSSTSSKAIADEPIASYRTDLLDLAFRTASAFPTMPHLKNRARAQETVVDACFELDQPRRALGYVERIDNWRRGAGYAEFALYSARQGNTDEVDHYLDLAEHVALAAEQEEEQEWRRDRILSRMAQTQLVLGNVHEATRIGANVGESEALELRELSAELLGKDAVKSHLDALDAAATKSDTDLHRNSLLACVRLAGVLYSDREQRQQLEQKVLDSWGRLPAQMRLEIIEKMAGQAIEHGDDARALELVEHAAELLELDWLPGHRAPLMARIAELRWRAGDRERGRREIDEALAVYHESREAIVDVFRREALIPVAEALCTMGDLEAARAVYEQAIDESVINPNSRPRANDLSAICVSMARMGFEPDEAQWARLREVHASLGDPW